MYSEPPLIAMASQEQRRGNIFNTHILDPLKFMGLMMMVVVHIQPLRSKHNDELGEHQEHPIRHSLQYLALWRWPSRPSFPIWEQRVASTSAVNSEGVNADGGCGSS